MKNIIFVISIILLLLFIPINIQPQNQFSTLKQYPTNNNTSITSKPAYIRSTNNVSQNFEIHEITDIATGYDYQSNASPQQIWVDLNNPNYLHAIFTNSQSAIPQSQDRTSYYFGSTDAGSNWFLFGGVPMNNGTSGNRDFQQLAEPQLEKQL